MSESIVSNLSEQCAKCQKLEKENEELRQQLAASRSSSLQLGTLIKIKQQLNLIRMLAATFDIQIDEMVKAIRNGLDRSFAIKSNAIVEKGSLVIQLISKLNSSKEESSELKSESESEIKKEQENHPQVKPQKQKVERKEESASSSDIKVDQLTQKKKESPVKEKVDNPTQKQAPTLFDQLNSYNSNLFKKEEVPYLPREQTPSGASSNKDEQEQKRSELSGSYDNVSMPLIWQKRTFFEMNGKIIRKLYNDVYKKIRTEAPLPRLGKHTVKIQMVNNGTFAFGIVTSPFKDQHMIDDRKCDALKYITFENGGGLVKLCGEEILGGPRVHLSPGQVLEVNFNADENVVIFKNPALMKSLEIVLPGKFKNKDLYFFLEMKQVNTAVRMI